MSLLSFFFLLRLLAIVIIFSETASVSRALSSQGRLIGLGATTFGVDKYLILVLDYAL